MITIFVLVVALAASSLWVQSKERTEDRRCGEWQDDYRSLVDTNGDDIDDSSPDQGLATPDKSQVARVVAERPVGCDNPDVGVRFIYD